MRAPSGLDKAASAVTFLFFVALAAGCVAWFVWQNNDCTDRGGVLVQGASVSGWVCVQGAR